LQNKSAKQQVTERHTQIALYMLLKGTVSPVYNYLKVIAFKSPWYGHIAPDIKAL
jgi:hypothetical protein